MHQGQTGATHRAPSAGAVRALQEARNGRRRKRSSAICIRAGIESTHAEGIRRCGLRQARYVGLAKAHLQHLATAAALNFVRLGEWLAGTRGRRPLRPLATLKVA